jgi:hypothetical protein
MESALHAAPTTRVEIAFVGGAIRRLTPAARWEITTSFHL